MGNLGEEGPFYWQLERGDIILLGKFGRGPVEFFIYA